MVCGIGPRGLDLEWGCEPCGLGRLNTETPVGVSCMKRGSIGIPQLLLLTCSVTFIIPACAQMPEGRSESSESPSASHLGYPEDWSSRHLVITGDRATDPLSAGFREPRHVYNRVLRATAEKRERHDMEREDHDRRRRWPRRAIHVDWAVSLGTGSCPPTNSPLSTGSTSPRKAATVTTLCSG